MNVSDGSKNTKTASLRAFFIKNVVGAQMDGFLVLCAMYEVIGILRAMAFARRTVRRFELLTSR